ncbi:MAG: CpaF family protein, partial [Thermodesulfobacteriota bacterium]|nr:CpaF family protein [Thermodesulfobacteriota bacterium]
MNLAARLNRSMVQRDETLREPKDAGEKAPSPESISAQDRTAAQGQDYHEIKTKIHNRLIQRMDLSVLESLSPNALGTEIAKLVERILENEFQSVPLNSTERKRLMLEVQDEVMGLGPLEPLLQDPAVTDILVNSYKQVFVERFGKLEPAEVRFKDDAHLRKIIDRIVSRVG